MEGKGETYFKRTTNTHPRPLSHLPIHLWIRKPPTNLLKPLSILKPISLYNSRATMLRQSIEPEKRAQTPIARMVSLQVGDIVELNRVTEPGFPRYVLLSFLEGATALFVA